MLEITRKNCYKCDLETIINNNSQYFWINLKDFEVETESKWLNIFNKHGNSSTLKYRRELTPNIKFQADRIFVRNDLFEKIIKSCKATNVEFLMLKEKLGLCPYEVICNEQEFILSEIQDDIEELKNENKEPKEIKSSEEPMKLNNPKKDENATDRYDKNKFEKILDVVNSDKFNYKNKIGKISYNDIKNLVDSINKNTISEILAKENINTLNKLKKAEKDKRLISGQKELLSFFDDLLDTILTENNNNNNDDNDYNDNDDNDDDDNNEDDDDNEEENEEKDEDGDEVKDEKYYIIKQINDYYKTIEESKSFEEQINLFKKNKLFI